MALYTRMERLVIHGVLIVFVTVIAVAGNPDKRQIDFSIHVKPTILNSTTEWLNVTVQIDEGPLPTDWIGIYSPPVNGTIDYHNQRPIKFLLCSTDPSYEKNGIGHYMFRLVNIRQDYIVGVFSGRSSSPILHAASQPISFEEVNNPLQIHLSLGQDYSEMTVVWSTKNSTKNQVCYGETATSLECIPAEVRSYNSSEMCGQPALSSGWIDPGQILVATMTKLKPATQYYYQVGSYQARMSDKMTFKTPPEPGSTHPLTFVIIGDTGSEGLDKSDTGIAPFHPGETFKSVLSLVKNGSVNLVMHLGGLSYAAGHGAEWDQFFTEIELIASAVPYMTSIGAYEADYPGSRSYFQGKESGGECGIPYQKRLIMPQPDATKHWYNIVYGSVHIVVMSTEHDFTNGSEQHQYLDKTLANVNRQYTPWVILAGHRPMYVDSTYDEISENPPISKQLRENLEPLLNKHKVDLALWAFHDSYQRTCPVFQGQCNKSSTVHVVVGMGGAELETDREGGKDWLDFLDEHHHGYVTLNVSSKSLTLDYYRNDDTTVYDTIQLNK